MDDGQFRSEPARSTVGGITRRSTLRGLAMAGVTAGATPVAAHAGGHDGSLAEVTIGLDLVASGFESPVDYLHAPETRNRGFVPDQPGVIHVVDGGRRTDPFLDIRDRVAQVHNEAGLLGLAFHPDFAENGRLFVRYSATGRDVTPAEYSHTFVLSEFQTTEDSSAADPESERTLLEIPQPQGNHNAGDIDFGPDGYLYVGVGDGGAAGDQGQGHVGDWYDAVGGGNGQDVTENLLGSILRIDVDDRTGEQAYGIPDDNPLVGRDGLDEHYAWGLRNPWRISFDDETGRLFVGDVGQDAWEEVNIVERGGNYGWNVREGTTCFQGEECPSTGPRGDPLLDPIVQYAHPERASDGALSGISITGGHVYRGDSVSALQGAYVFGDFLPNGELFVAIPPSEDSEEWALESVPIHEGDTDKLPTLTGIGRDRSGELYLTTRGQASGAVYRLLPHEPANTTTVAVDDTPPATEDSSGSGQQAPTTPADGPGLGITSALLGVTAGAGIVRWLSR